MTLVRVFCLLPYLPDGETDPIARAVLETFSNRLTHEKYAAAYGRGHSRPQNLYKVKADSPALINFLALLKWVDPASAEKFTRTSACCADRGLFEKLPLHHLSSGH